MKTNVLTLVITLTLGVILAGSLLMPVIADAQHDNRTVALNTTATYTMSNGGVDLTLERAVGSSEIILNGTVIENHNGIIVTANNFDVRAQSDGQIMITDLANNRFSQVSNSTSLSLTIDNTDVSYTVGTTTRTLTLSGDILYIDSDGKYGGFYEGSSLQVNVTPGVEIYAILFPSYAANQGWSTFGVVKIVDGEVKDVIVAPQYISGGAYIEAVNPVYTVTADYNESGDYWTYDYVGVTTDEFTLRKAEIIAPLEYNEITTADAGIIALYGAIPVILIVSLVVAAIGAIYTKRND